MEGSLTGFSLDEIFELLAMKKKSGVLEITRIDDSSGKACFKEGLLYWAETPTITSPLPEGDDNAAKERIEDALLEIFDWDESVYRFDAQTKVEHSLKTMLTVESVLADVKKRQAEWAEIRTEIPSLKARVELISKLGKESISLSKKQWWVIALITRLDTVEELKEELKVSPLAACRLLYDMSKLGLIRCLGEVKEEGSGSPTVKEAASSKGSKKYIRKSLIAEDEANAIPAEWSSYYQLLKGRRTVAKDDRTSKVVGH